MLEGLSCRIAIHAPIIAIRNPVSTSFRTRTPLVSYLLIVVASTVTGCGSHDDSTLMVADLLTAANTMTSTELILPVEPQYRSFLGNTWVTSENRPSGPWVRSTIGSFQFFQVGEGPRTIELLCSPHRRLGSQTMSLVVNDNPVATWTMEKGMSVYEAEVDETFVREGWNQASLRFAATAPTKGTPAHRRLAARCRRLRSAAR